MRTIVNPKPQAPPSRPLRAGFTLIEMLAVITIIAILLALSVTTGVLVVGRQDKATTRGLLSTLDRTLEEVLIETGAFPPFVATAYENTPGQRVIAGGADNLVETYLDRDQVRHPDAAVFLEQAQGIGQSDAIIANLGDRFVVPTPTADDTSTVPSILDAWGDAASWGATANGPIDDAWPIFGTGSQIIYYVHPDNRLAQDLYGRCVNGRPYFFSAGPDELYGTSSQLTPNGEPDSAAFGEEAALGLEDNLYSYTVDEAVNDVTFNMETR